MLTKGFLKRKYNELAVCSFLCWVVTLAGGLSHSIFAGIFMSEDAVAAVGLVNPVFSVIFFLSAFLSAGGNALYSQYAGEFDTEKCKRVAGSCLVYSFICGIVVLAVMIVAEDMYFSFYAAAPEIEAMAREYYKVFFILAVLYPLYYSVYYLVIADGDSGLLVLVEIVNAAANVLLSLIFIQKMGIKGLAIGTVVSTLLSFGVLLLHFAKKTNGLHFKLCLNKDYFLKMLSIGSSTSLTYLYLAVVGIVINKEIIVMFGTYYLPAYTVINTIIEFEGCFTSGIGGASAFISISYGEKNPVGQKKACDYAAKTTIALGVAMCVIIQLLATTLPEFYGISDPAVFADAVYASRILGVSYLVASVVTALSSYYAKVDQVFLGNVIVAINNVIAPLACSMVLDRIFGFKGLIWGFFLPPVFALLFCFIYIAAKYGIREFPYLLVKSSSIIFNHELKLVPEEIAELLRLTQEELRSCNVDDETANRVLLVLEDTFMLVRDKNNKQVLADSTLLINDDQVQLITRDSGMIFDITDTDAKIGSLREYVVARLMTLGQENIYLTTTSFNRNSYVWKR